MRTLASLALLVPLAAGAMPDDRRQPIQIQADSFELNQATGVGTYRGNVTLVQGSLQLKADQLVLHREGDRLTRAVADGHPARFRQRPSADAKEIEGEGRSLDYKVGENKVFLTGDARILQGRDEFNGEKIVYNTATSVVQATGRDGGGRITATIQPHECKDGKDPEGNDCKEAKGKR